MEYNLKPKVSIVTVCLNSSKFIQKNIESVNKQTYKNIEQIFVDGKSKDNTLEIIKKNASRDSKIISEKDKGIYDAMNKGVKISNGDIICFLNSDDSYTDNFSISSTSCCSKHTSPPDISLYAFVLRELASTILKFLILSGSSIAV